MVVKADQFTTVSEDLLEAAVLLANMRTLAGFHVTVEPDDIHLPSTPALKLKSGSTTTYVEVGSSRIPKGRLQNWVLCAESDPKDTRILYCCNSGVSNASQTWLLKKRIGLSVCDKGEILDILRPHDLAMKLGLPDIGTLKPALRRKLSTAYEKHDQGDRKAAFEEACKAFELECRTYLKKHVSTGRKITFLDSNTGKIRKPSKAAIERMPMGVLATNFDNIIGKNQLDSRIGKSLKQINPDRITVAHNKRKNEARLRRNAGRNMSTIIRCLKEMQNR